MCGIAGIFSTKLTNDEIAPKLEAMQHAINHRGPDGHGDFLSPSAHAGLIHTRLSIIDLSDNAAQPMSSTDGRYTISFNGEIYNYQELRKELEQAGYVFSSNSDTEVLLYLYAQESENCLTKLRGMFAFVIWDEQEQVAFAARDPLGIKPFYFCHDDASFACASELRAVIASGLSEQSLDSQGLHSYLTLGAVAEPNTLINDITLLPAGHYLTWSNGKTKVNQYWHFNFKNEDTLTYAQAVEQTRSALVDSIKAHFVSDVPVGLFLSGGIDSTALLALASKISDKPINTYSIAFEDPQWNEGDVAKRVAEHFGSNHTQWLMTPELAQPLFDDFLNVIDQPSIDGFNTFCVAKLAQQNGQKVVLSGLGGDELFAGYKSFKVLPKMTALSTLMRWCVTITRLKAKLLTKYLPAKLRRVFDFMSQPGSLTAAQQSLRGIFSNHEAQQLASTISAQPLNTPTRLEPSNSNIADNISELELSTYMRNQLLRDSDVMSMHWGLELRVPFVDRQLIETISAIPAKYRLRLGKQLLIDSVPEIPEWVVNRPKQGFRFPFDKWFSNSWKTLEQQTEPHSNMIETSKWIKLTPWYRRWSLIVLNDWIRRYAK